MSKGSGLNIGLVCYAGFGGSGVIASELGIGLMERGHKVHVVSSELPFRLVNMGEKIKFHEVSLYSYPVFKHGFYGLSLSSKLVEVCEEEDLDILHVHYAIPHSIAGYLAKGIVKRKGLRLITTLHGTDITLVGQQASYKRLVEFGIQESDGVSSVSEYLKAVTLKEFGVRREIEVISNFVDEKRFYPLEEGKEEGKVREWEEGGEKLVIHVSNFRVVKNGEGVVRVFDRIRRELSGVKLLLVGDGPEMGRLRGLIKELGLVGSINFLGQVHEVERILPRVDLCLFPSYMESFGLVVLEAMSCGVPVIGSDVGGIGEVIEEGRTGYMFNPEDIEGMARKSIEILKDGGLKGWLGRNGRERVERYFSFDGAIREYEGFYEKILRRG